MNTVIVYTDGACSKQKHKSVAAYGIFVAENHPWNESGLLQKEPVQTNQVAELCAIRRALELGLMATCNSSAFMVGGSSSGGLSLMINRLIIKTDSMYAVNIYTQWALKWHHNGWKRKTRSGFAPVKNLRIIQETLKLLFELEHLSIQVIFQHVSAHRPKPVGEDVNSEVYMDWYGNMQADRLAQEAVRKALSGIF